MVKTKKKAGAATAQKKGRAKLDAGAADIRKLEKKTVKAAKPNGEVKKVEPPLQIVESTRNEADIVRDYVKVLPGSIGLEISDKLPLEESLKVLDWACRLNDHVGFMIGDVVNFGQHAYGEKYRQALAVTNRARSTLWGYAETARRIPANDRIAALSFSHHRELIRLPDKEALDKALTELKEQVDGGQPIPTRDEVRNKIMKLTPRKAKAKKATSGKGKSKAKEPEIVYTPTADEQSALDVAEESIHEAVGAVKDGGVIKLTYKLPNKDKKRWLKALLPFYDWYKSLEHVTGYEA